MKSILLFTLIMMSQFSFAQTLKEKKVKEQMLSRVDSIILKLSEAREALSKEDAALTCQKINELFKILPDHLISVGTSMNLFDSKVIKMENESKMFLIYIHQRSNICGNGENGEYLDIGKTDKKFKDMKKAFEKQRKFINKSDTSYENRYSYYYEF